MGTGGHQGISEGSQWLGACRVARGVGWPRSEGHVREEKVQGRGVSRAGFEVAYPVLRPGSAPHQHYGLGQSLPFSGSQCSLLKNGAMSDTHHPPPQGVAERKRRQWRRGPLADSRSPGSAAGGAYLEGSITL